MDSREGQVSWKKMMQTRAVDADFEDADIEIQVADTVQSKWQDLPMELLVRILALVDDRTVVLASGVCTGWRDSISAGVIGISFNWCKKNVSQLVHSLAHKFSRVESCSIRRCTFLNDDAIKAVGSHWHDLRSLDLTNSARLTNISLIALADGCPLLQKLDLSGCTGISEAGLVGLTQHCKDLRHLNICGCHNAGSDAALEALAQNCSSLRYLNVGWCAQITDVGVTALALGCSDLRFLDFCGCLQITDQSVIVLADHCARLRVLGFHCCRNITDLAMYALVNASKRRNKSRSNKRSSSTSFTTRGREGGEYYSISSGSRSSPLWNSPGICCNDPNTVTFSKTADGGFDTSYLSDPSGHGLVNLNISGCTALSSQAVQAVCDEFPQLHTCPERNSLLIGGCLNLTTVGCICVIEARRERLNRISRAAGDPSYPHPWSL